jgi:FemAB-related protein (PEP-CTERM system-associated)
MIEIVGDADFSEWDAYVARHPEATLYNLGGWGTVAKHAYGIHPYLLLSRASAGAPVRGGLPLFVVSRLWTSYVTSGIFGAYGPIVADDDGTRAELFEAARRFADDHHAAHLHIKALGEGPTPPGFVRHDIWMTAKLPLSGGPEAAWHGLRKSSIRTKVHHAERAGLEVRWGKGDLDAFYDVLADNMHRKGSPIYGKRFMHELVGVFGDRADIVTLWLGDQPISGALTLVHGGVMYAPFTSSRPAYFKLRPNDLLYWRMIERAAQQALSAFDFGSSMRGASTLAFKRHFRPVVEPVASFVYTRAAEQPVLAPENAAVKAVVGLWKRMPRSAADALGPVVSRYIA